MAAGAGLAAAVLAGAEPARSDPTPGRIAYVHQRSEGFYTLTTIRLNGTGARRVVTPRRGYPRPTLPRFSPDGKQLAFANFGGGPTRPGPLGRRDRGRACCHIVRGVLPDAGIAEDRVVVSGTASRSVPADRAVWALVVVETGEAPAEAFGRCGRRLDALTRALRDALGEAAEVRTGALSVQPQRDVEGRRLETVEVRGQVVVDVPVEAVGRASGAAMSAGADRLEGPALEVRAATAIGEELLADAVAAARREAERIASAAGRRLGRVVSVAEEGRWRHPSARRGDGVGEQWLGRAGARAVGRAARGVGPGRVRARGLTQIPSSSGVLDTLLRW